MKMALAVLIVQILHSCEMHCVTGSGHVTVEHRPVTSEFKNVKASNGLDVIVEQSEKTSITVEADDNVQKHISTKIENGVLIISSDCNSYINATKTITVQLPAISGIVTSSGANLHSKNTLKGEQISVKASSGADIKIGIETDKATCETSSGSHINIVGKAIELETASSSGSDIDAKQLMSNSITASASSGSTIDVHPLVSLNAKASSGANVNYYNVPKNLQKKSSSGGSINKE